MKGFTLIELLVVVAIMGLLGTASVGGYRQMQRGMEERGVMQTVNSFVRAAYERAQIDRQPTKIYCWNETIREETEDANVVVVGHAVAVRPRGRISRIDSAEGGRLLIDEFGDLEQFDENGAYADAPDNDTKMRLYQMDNTSEFKYSTVKVTPVTPNGKNDGGQDEIFITHDPINDSGAATGRRGRIIQYGFVETASSGANWRNGSVYGFEFQTIELPHGYIFGTDYARTIESPIKEITSVIYRPNSSSATPLQVCSLRAGKGGTITAQRVGTTDNPSQNLD